MLQKTGKNRALAIVIFEKLFSELPEQVQKIEKFLLNQEMTEAQLIVHKLHGSMSFCGFIELQELSRQLEKSLLTKELEQTNQSFVLLKEKLLILFSLQEKILQQLEKSI
jgi:HPt (histidine-containing phosphotransfer) domain-containing protein